MRKALEHTDINFPGDKNRHDYEATRHETRRQVIREIKIIRHFARENFATRPRIYPKILPNNQVLYYPLEEDNKNVKDT